MDMKSSRLVWLAVEAQGAGKTAIVSQQPRLVKISPSWAVRNTPRYWQSLVLQGGLTGIVFKYTNHDDHFPLPAKRLFISKRTESEPPILGLYFTHEYVMDTQAAMHTCLRTCHKHGGLKPLYIRGRSEAKHFAGNCCHFLPLHVVNRKDGKS